MLCCPVRVARTKPRVQGLIWLNWNVYFFPAFPILPLHYHTSFFTFLKHQISPWLFSFPLKLSPFSPLQNHHHLRQFSRFWSLVIMQEVVWTKVLVGKITFLSHLQHLFNTIKLNAWKWSLTFITVFPHIPTPHHFRFNFNSFAWRNFEDFGFQIQYEKIRVWSLLNWGRTGPLIIGGNFGDYWV